MNLLLIRMKFLITLIVTFTFIIPAQAEQLSTMVNKILESHEDMINAKKLEEASRDVTDAMLVYAPISQ